MFDLFKCAYFRWPGWNSWCGFWKWEIFWWWFTTCLRRSWKVGCRFRIPGQFVIFLPFFLLFAFSCVYFLFPSIFAFTCKMFIFRKTNFLMGIMKLKDFLSLSGMIESGVPHILIWTKFSSKLVWENLLPSFRWQLIKPSTCIIYTSHMTY